MIITFALLFYPGLGLALSECKLWPSFNTPSSIRQLYEIYKLYSTLQGLRSQRVGYTHCNNSTSIPTRAI